jgi:DNA replication ATP-dependent helicase Dna2
VSDKTKNKLLAFQFDPQPSELPKASKPTGGDAQDSISNQVLLSAGNTAEATATPAGRPTWQDLLGECEVPKTDQERSPGERILWCNDYNATQPIAISPLLPRKGRKRARSSSPTSSPTAKHLTPGIDAKKLAQVLKTPRADPASELWDRFSLPGREASPSGLTNPLLAQLMVSSSPRPPAEGGGLSNDRSLRKTVSCGSHWPKRRKLERAHSDKGDSVARDSIAASKSFMVSALLETVDGEIRKSKPADIKANQQAQSPSTRTTKVPSPARPSPKRPQRVSSPLAQKSARAGIEANGIIDVSSGEKVSSDYGDDDFDDETFMELEASINLAQGDESTLVMSDDNSPEPQAIKTLEDDFGDLDDDLFDGAVDLVAEVEAKHLSQNQPDGQRHQASSLGWGEDEAFEDDFRDIDFEAVEVATTKAASHPFSSNVRTTR